LTRSQIVERLRESVRNPLPLPGAGQTALRHGRLMDVGREDLSLARLVEAHWDAVAILAEAGRDAEPDALYGVWAAEIPGEPLRMERMKGGWALHGSKMFCSGAGMVDRALVTVGDDERRLVDVDLRGTNAVVFDDSAWATDAFEETKTATAMFDGLLVQERDWIGGVGWYLDRPGFWHGACGPAACWAGGALALVDWAKTQRREDPHTLAHLGAMHAGAWALRGYLEAAGREIDAAPMDVSAAQARALTVRHLVEQAATEILRRLARGYGPYPLAMEVRISRCYRELDLYLRQSHAERDLESLGRDVRTS
jgi:alkylation response protein AidB-like acyl-CoA dehydrogenase